MPNTAPVFSDRHNGWGMQEIDSKLWVNNDWHKSADAAVEEFDELICPVEMGKPVPPKIILRANHPYVKRHPFFKTEGRKAIEIKTTMRGTGIKRDRGGDKLARVREVMAAMPTAKLADLVAAVHQRNKEDISPANARYLITKIQKEG